MRCARSRSLTVTISTAALVFIIIFIVLGQFTAHALQITKNNWNDGYKCITMNVCSFILSLDMYVMYVDFNIQSIWTDFSEYINLETKILGIGK